MSDRCPRRRFLQITAVGTGLAGAASLAGANRAAAVTSGLTALTHPGVLRSRADVTRDTAHATKALQIIRSWTNALRETNGKDAEQAAGIYGAKLAAAVEITLLFTL
ncbi:hypothetical protein [Streptomyces blattellae]|uniref:hypothetical protein n=1 Tax=Streptomyces blattellae TaxID=2569855 RepID=UPI0012B72ACC|nr:hypothetical protein [Streptomyces blattellae]